ncbi:hypothetical protein PI124_g17043 [Phytophthora idaei]|nr:hypothetical protein PI125_g17507 [Phytophthora idaei]KAG3139722.1 hypothetical protein PI126_g16335 [Phytophthora idaei]KAG3237974.1 hypothetical protein PI124_g17043 [Phytophthora idaei]
MLSVVALSLGELLIVVCDVCVDDVGAQFVSLAFMWRCRHRPHQSLPVWSTTSDPVPSLVGTSDGSLYSTTLGLFASRNSSSSSSSTFGYTADTCRMLGLTRW